MASFLGFARRFWAIDHPPEASKSADAIRIGIFGASWIAPMAIITPAKSHPEVIIAAIAARDRKKATAYAKKYGIPNVHASYQDLLDDPIIDAVYIPLPNGLHYEWALKALRAGKHVLLEKPSVSNAAEAVALFNYHASLPDPAPVLLEAFHYHFHPTWHTFLSLLDPPNIESASANLAAPLYFLGKDDIRFNYELAGGALMDMGCYCISVLRTVFGTEPEECMSAQARMISPECDEAMKTSWRFPNGGVGRIEADLRKSAGWGLPKLDTPAVIVRQKEAELSVGESDVSLRDGQTQFRTRTATLWNFIQPSYWHRIDVVDEHVIKEASGAIVKRWTTKKSKKAYTWGDLRKEGTIRTGEDYWSTYRHMLEQFVSKIKGKPGSGLWFSGEDSIKQMQVIDGAYEKAGLRLRPTSTYQ